MNLQEALIFFIGRFWFFIFLFALYISISYVYNASALQNMAIKMNIKHDWVSWIPLANTYVLGKIPNDEVLFFGIKINGVGVILITGLVISSVVATVPLIGVFVIMFYVWVYYSTYMKIYKLFMPEKARKYFVLSLTIPMAGPFLLFKASQNNPIIR